MLFLLTAICGLCFTACSSPTQETKSYTVTFNANEATSGTAPTAQRANNGASITLPGDNGLAKTGCTFGGWNTRADGAGTNYAAGSSYTVNATITLYAKWNPSGASSTVTFDSNGATSGTAPAAQTVNAGISITLPGDNGLARPGYTFGGWNTEASGAGTNYAAGDSYIVTRTITLYAKWNAIPGYTFTVTFNDNGATSGTAPPAQKVEVGASITLPGDNGLEKTDYTFGGWNTEASGTGTNYSAGFSYTVTDNIIFYAQWNSSGGNLPPNPPHSTVTVTFNINSASGTAPPAQTVNSGSNITLPHTSGFYKTGYTFDGWNTNAAGTGTNYAAGASYTVTDTITLYAKWNVIPPAVSYTVTFSANGATSGTAPATQTVNAGSSITLPFAGNLSKDGYTFGGWNTNAGGTGDNYAAGASYTVNATTTLYAKWNEAPPGTMSVVFTGFGDESINLTKNTDIGISKSQNQLLIVTINGEYSGSYQLYLDGNSWYWASGSGSATILDASDFSVGIHTMSVVVYSGSVPHSKTVTFRVVY